jgi:hypothetical protein
MPNVEASLISGFYEPAKKSSFYPHADIAGKYNQKFKDFSK